MKKLKNIILAFLVLFVGIGLTACDNGNKTYTITYQLTKDLTNENPTSYTENTETVILKDLEDTIEFEFLGWYNGETKVTEIKKKAQRVI